MTPRYQLSTMKPILFVGIIAGLALAMITAGFGINNATAQLMADNATMAGNMTGGNMTMGPGNMTDTNMTEASGGISGVGQAPF
jgi:hypothetical protein